jgi:hypothetical protein
VRCFLGGGDNGTCAVSDLIGGSFGMDGWMDGDCEWKFGEGFEGRLNDGWVIEGRKLGEGWDRRREG